MGYYTKFGVIIFSGYKENHQKYMKELQSLYGYDFTFDEDFTMKNEKKWYECMYSMEEFSAKYKGVFFVVIGQGEADWDTWIRIFKDGKNLKYRKVKSRMRKLENDYDKNKMSEEESNQFYLFNRWRCCRPVILGHSARIGA